MKQVTLKVAKLCDLYLDQQQPNGVGIIQNSLQECQNAKARLLYYFPTSSSTTKDKKEKGKEPSDDWCGWHKDHGSLTCLLPGMIFGTQDEDNPAGLYIETRQKDQVRVVMPPTSIGIQLGETLEIQSAGRFRATPHAVKSGTTSSTTTKNSGGRSTLALFLQPNPEQPLPSLYDTVEDASLQARWRPTFGAFQKATTEAFN